MNFSTSAVPAVPHDYPSRLGVCAFATGLFNLLDLPAGIVPVGTVTLQDDKLLADENCWHTGSIYVSLLSTVDSSSFEDYFLRFFKIKF